MTPLNAELNSRWTSGERGLIKATVVALILSTLVVVAPAQVDQAQATSGPIIYNNGVCELSDAGYLGTGSSASPYQISNSDSLWEVADCSITNSAPAHFKITRTITVSEAVHAPTSSPIGTSTSGAIAFRGVLDGDEWDITGISMSSIAGVGLFAKIDNAEFFEVRLGSSRFMSTTTTPNDVTHGAGGLAAQAVGTNTFSYVIFDGEVSGFHGVGGIVGFAEGPLNLEHVTSVGTTKITGVAGVGGFAGSTSSTVRIHNGNPRGTVSGSSAVGGAVGFSAGLSVTSGYFLVPVTGDSDVGGIAGLVSGGPAEITDSVNGSRTIGRENVGGLIGRAVLPGSDPIAVRIVESRNIQDVIGTGDQLGGFVGRVDGQSHISQSTNSGNIAGDLNDSDRIGGFIGRATSTSTLISVLNEGNIQGDTDLGGLIGGSDGRVDVSFSTNTGDISGDGDVGGLVGEADNASFSNSINSGNVSGVQDDVGGFVGSAQLAGSTISFLATTNTGSISGSNHVGGFTGSVENVSFDSSANSGTISGVTSVGGLSGDVDESFVANRVTNSGAIVAIGSRAGGLAGEVSFATVSFSHNVAPISAADFVGGLIGNQQALSATIFASSNTGNISASELVGGLVGDSSGLAIELSFNTGDIRFDNRGGGLVGDCSNGTRGHCSVSSSYSTGGLTPWVVASADEVGGLIGWAQTALISNAFNSGDLVGDDNVGGLVGKATTISITASYNAGALTGNTNFDGLVGTHSSIATASVVTNVVSRLTALSTTAQMQQAGAYAGFNLNTTWGFGTCSDNGGFPMLRAFAQVGTFNAAGCITPIAPDSVGTSAPGYSGPIVDGAKTGLVGSEVSFTGSKLNEVTSVLVGGIAVSIVRASSQSLVIKLPESLAAGSYDLVMQSSFGIITLQGALTVLATESTEVTADQDGKITVGSFKGFIAIYTKGYEGQRLSVKVAGRWLVVPEISENWKGNDYSRTTRFTGAGKAIKLHLYIDREFVRTEELRTK